MNNDLSSLLNSYNVSALRDMVKTAGFKGTNAKGRNMLKVELVQFIIQELFSAERIQSTYAQLNDTERAVLERIQLKEKPITTTILRSQLIRAGLVTKAPAQQRSYYQSYEGRPYPRSSRIFEDVMARLTQFALVFGNPKTTYSGAASRQSLSPGVTLFIPDVVRRHLPSPTLLEDKFTNWEPEKVVTGDPFLSVRDLYLYWDACRRTTVQLLKSGHVGKRSLKAINELLLVQENVAAVRGEADLPRLYSLRETLQKQKMITATNGELQAVEKPGFWELSTRELIGDIIRAWSSNPALSNVDDAKSYETRPIRAFDVLLSTLVRLRPNNWIALADLTERLREVDANFYFQGRSSIDSSPYGTHSFGGVYFSNPDKLLDELDSLESAFVQSSIYKLLQPCGIIDIGLGEYKSKGVEAVRLTTFGRAVVQNIPYEPPSQAGRVIVQPSFQLLAMGTVPISTLAKLDQIAERVKVDRNVFEYTLTRDSVYAAQQGGFSADAITTFLEKETGTPLPQNVRRSLTEWGARHERIVFRPSVMLVQANSAEQLDALQQTTRNVLDKTLTDTIAILNPKKRKQLQDALLEQGVLPTADRADKTDNSVLIDAEGMVTLQQRTPSLFIVGQLAKIAEQQSNGRWQITRSAFERSATNKEETTRFLTELERLQIGMLPSELARKIKMWGSFYGKVAVETLTLVAFQDEDTLHDLMQHDALAGLLRPFPDANRPLAVIPTDKVADIQSYLSALGIDVVEGVLSK